MSMSVELGQFAKVFNGKTPAKSDQRTEGHPVLKIKDVSEMGDFKGAFESFVDPEFAKKHLKKTVQSNDVLVLNAAHNADYVGSKIYKAEAEVEGAIATGEWLLARSSDPRLRQDYLWHWFQAPSTRFQISKRVKGIHLYPRDVADLEIPLPPIDEQRRIAAILDKADAIRRKRQQILTLADEFLQSVFLEMFGDPATSGCYGDLGSHIDFVTSGSRGWARYYAKTGSRFIRSLDVQMNYIADEDAVFVNPPSSAEAVRCRVEIGDVLLTITGSKIGRVADVRELTHKTYISQHVAIIRLKKSLLPEFVSFFLSLPSLGQRQIEKVQYGQAKPGLNLSQIREFQLPIPTMDKQTEFLRILKTTRKTIDKLQFQLTESESFFASLSQRAFRGEL